MNPLLKNKIDTTASSTNYGPVTLNLHHNPYSWPQPTSPDLIYSIHPHKLPKTDKASR